MAYKNKNTKNAIFYQYCIVQLNCKSNKYYNKTSYWDVA